MTLLGDQSEVTSRSPLKVRSLDAASVVAPITGETVTFLYNNAGTLASATGQAAGTYIYAKLAYSGILNSFKDKVGDTKDTSFAFTTGTVLTTKTGQELQRTVDNWKNFTVAEKFTEIEKFITTNGDFWIDHADGAVWGRAAAVVADDTAAYSVKSKYDALGAGYVDEARDRALVQEAAVVTEVYNETPFAFTGSAATVNISATDAVLTGFELVNNGNTFLWVIFNDDANTITGGDAAEIAFPLPPNSVNTKDASFFKAKQYGFTTNGLAVGISTTQATYTAHATPSEVVGTIMYHS